MQAVDWAAPEKTSKRHISARIAMRTDARCKLAGVTSPFVVHPSRSAIRPVASRMHPNYGILRPNLMRGGWTVDSRAAAAAAAAAATSPAGDGPALEDAAREAVVGRPGTHLRRAAPRRARGSQSISTIP